MPGRIVLSIGIAIGGDSSASLSPEFDVSVVSMLLGTRLLPRGIYVKLNPSSPTALKVAFWPQGTFSISVESAGTERVTRSAL
jgi:hypothetical protein